MQKATAKYIPESKLMRKTLNTSIHPKSNSFLNHTFFPSTLEKRKKLATLSTMSNSSLSLILNDSEILCLIHSLPKVA